MPSTDVLDVTDVPRVPRLTSPADALARVAALRAVRPGRRLVVAVAGEPGSGKSTVAAAVVAALTASGTSAVGVPMDGFHLAGSTLARLGRLDRKGAVDAFDADGYLALLRRLREHGPATVWAPDYVRGVEESIGGAIEVGPEVEVVVTEGNYLLVDDEPWRAVREVVDETWAVHVPHGLRLDRLAARHAAFGMAQEAARAWAEGPDEAAARLVRPTLAAADVQVDGAGAWG